MAGQFRIKRRIHNLTLTENSVTTVEVPRGYDLESLFFRLYGTANITTGGSAVRAMAPTQLIKRIELIADGKNTIASVPFWYLARCAHRSMQGLLTPPSAATAAAYSIEASGVLDQALIDGMRPKDSNLRTSGMSMLQLRITTGAATDLLTGSPAGSMTSFSLDISTSEVVELPDAKGEISKPLYLQKRAYQDVSVTASNANQQIILPVGNALRGVDILAKVNGEPSNSVVNSIQLASGVDVRYLNTALNTQRENSQQYEGVGILSNTTGFQSSSINLTGLYRVDLMKNGPGPVHITDAWDLSKASEAKLVLDVTGGAGYELTIVTTEFLG